MWSFRRRSRRRWCPLLCTRLTMAGRFRGQARLCSCMNFSCWPVFWQVPWRGGHVCWWVCQGFCFLLESLWCWRWTCHQYLVSVAVPYHAVLSLFTLQTSFSDFYGACSTSTASGFPSFFVLPQNSPFSPIPHSSTPSPLTMMSILLATSWSRI